MRLITTTGGKRLGGKRCFSILIPLLILFLLTACGESQAKKPKKKNFVRKGDEIHFTLGGVSAYVPAAYFKGGSQDKLGMLHYVKLWALLPDFEVYDKNKNNDEFHPVRGFGRRVDITLGSRSQGPAKISEIVKSSVALEHTPLSGRLGKYDELIYSLEVYRSNSYGDDDYLYRRNGDTVAYLHCSSKKQDIPYPSCELLWDVSDRIGAKAVFSMDYLSYWKTVMIKVNGLVNKNHYLQNDKEK
ncbi:MAG: hypothetical protein ABW098_20540 [Candidatus Thiodiazotropha sp.]